MKNNIDNPNLAKEMVEKIEIDSINDLPIRFQAYTMDMNVETILNHYKNKYNSNPIKLYYLTVGKMKMIAIEIKELNNK